MFEAVFNKVAGLQLFLKETPKEMFSYEICEILKNTFFTEHLPRRLIMELLKCYMEDGFIFWPLKLNMFKSHKLQKTKC